MTQQNFQIGQASHAGRVRSKNEDSHDAFRAPLSEDVAGSDPFSAQIAVVADGIGGAVAGHYASNLAVTELRAFVTQEVLLPFPQRLIQGIQHANSAIVAASEADPQLHGMGTTIVVVALVDRLLYVAHAGDSRAYLIRDGAIRQLTVDHSWIQEAVDAQRLTREQAADHPNRHVIKRYLGIHSTVEPDVQIVIPDIAPADAEGSPPRRTAVALRMEDDDIILLCSDGLTDAVSDEQILDIVGSAPPQEACDGLVDAANAAGGPDNITAVVVARPQLSPLPEAATAVAADASTLGWLQILSQYGWVIGVALGVVALLLIVVLLRPGPLGGPNGEDSLTSTSDPITIGAQPTPIKSATYLAEMMTPIHAVPILTLPLASDATNAPVAGTPQQDILPPGSMASTQTVTASLPVVAISTTLEADAPEITTTATLTSTAIMISLAVTTTATATAGMPLTSLSTMLESATTAIPPDDNQDVTTSGPSIDDETADDIVQTVGALPISVTQTIPLRSPSDDVAGSEGVITALHPMKLILRLSRDNANLPVPDAAEVTLVNQGTRAERRTTASDVGEALFDQVYAGEYVVRVVGGDTDVTLEGIELAKDEAEQGGELRGDGMTVTYHATATTSDGERVYLPLINPPPAFPSIRNGAFDDVTEPVWTESSSWDQALIGSEIDVAEGADAPGFSARSSPNVAWLGRKSNDQSALWQSIVLPPKYPGVRLSFWYMIGSNERTCGDDWGYVAVDDTVLSKFGLCRDTNTNGWQRVEVSLSDYAGTTIDVTFRSTQDGAEVSNWFLDDVILCDGTSAHPCE